jgi:predicted permease
MTGSRYPDADSVRRSYDALWDRLEALPGAKRAGGVTTLPLSERFAWGPITAEGQMPPAGQTFINADQRTAAGRYFEAMDIELIEGRLFGVDDRADSDRVILVDERMARDLWPGETAIGKRIKSGDINAPDRWLTVVGVVRQVKHYGLDADARIALYRPHAQSTARTLFVTVRADGDLAALVPLVRGVVREIDPDLPLTDVRTMAERLDRSLARREFSMLLLAIFAGVAVVLSTIGVYGVMAYMVAQGTRDLGIRIALGASPGAIVGLVVRHGMTVAVTGVLVGLAAAFGLTRLMASLLFGVQATDSLTFTIIALALGLVSLLACLIPARRAARVDPVVALRSE